MIKLFFLEEVMHKMGFSRRWVQWIMLCVTTVRYSVKFNGVSPPREVSGKVTRYPRLCFFLLLTIYPLCYNKKFLRVVFRPSRFAEVAGISHLLFADDTLLFSKASCNQAVRVKAVINSYAEVTGQLINPSKYSIMFSPNCGEEIQDGVRDVLSIQHDPFDDKYLGFPTSEGRTSKEKIDKLEAMLSKRILQWGHLSQGGNEIMIKAVAQALPIYIMSVFKLPISVCDNLTKLIRDFWWGSEWGLLVGIQAMGWNYLNMG
jgi:hypothetical protein